MPTESHVQAEAKHEKMSIEEAVKIVTDLLDSKLQQSDEIEACLMVIDMLSKKVVADDETKMPENKVKTFRD